MSGGVADGADEGRLRRWLALRSQEHGDVLPGLGREEGDPAGATRRWVVECPVPVHEHTRRALADAFAGAPVTVREVPPPVGSSQWSFFLTHPFVPGDPQVWLSLRVLDPAMARRPGLAATRWEPGFYLGHPQPGPALPDARPLTAGEFFALRRRTTSDPGDAARCVEIVDRFAQAQREELAALRRAAGGERPATTAYHRALDAYGVRIERFVTAVHRETQGPDRGLGS